ncbi:MAG TPA: helix-turn-helix domain-containing protein [Acidimicrobiales bacterium]|nr:helix-turn-helix domain-containing protein [Acidimicrobiales bacterium]
MDRTERIWLTVDEAAGVLGVTLRELHRMIDSYRLRAYKIGRVVRIRRQDLEGVQGASPDGSDNDSDP